NYRADVRAVDPSSGTTTFGPGLFPDSFATTRDDVTYLGVVNRETGSRSIAVSLAALGLRGQGYTALNVSTGEASLVDDGFSVAVPGQGFRFLVLRSTPGLLRTDSVPTDQVADPDA